MIANLPMYERPETHGVLAALWAKVRDSLIAQGIAAPEHLMSGSEGITTWRSHSLLLGQTCGLPYRAALSDQVQLIGAPDLNIEGCEPGYYCSAIVVRADDARAELKDFETANLVCNSLTSQSGYAALKHHWEKASLVWPGHSSSNVTFSGGHLASAKQVASGDGDIAALDILSFNLMNTHDDFTNQLRVLEYTDPTPALPFICATQFDSALIADALRLALQSLTEQERQTLGFHGVVDLAPELYHQVPTPPECSAAFN